MEDINESWREFNEREDYYSLSLSSKRHYCLRMLSSLAEEKRKHEVQLEYDLLDFGMKEYYHLQSLNKVDKNEFEKATSEFVRKHTADDFDYYNKRFTETRNLSDKWRYSIACWFYNRSNIYYLETAISILLNCTMNRLGIKDYLTCIRTLTYAHNLARIYNVKYSKEIAKTAFGIINHVRNTEYARWLIEPIQVLLGLDDLLNHCAATYLITTLDKEALKFGSNPDMVDHFSLISKDLCRFLNLDNFEKEELRRIIQFNIAKAWERSGDKNMEEGNAIHAVFDYEKSIKEYEIAGDSDKRRTLGARIRDAGKKIQWDVTELIIKAQPIELKGDTEKDIAKSICNQRKVIPDVSKIRQAVERDLVLFPLQEAVSRVDFNKKSPVSHSTSREDLIQAEVQKKIVQHIQFEESRLSSAIRGLELVRRICPSTFLGVMDKLDFENETSLPLIEQGILKHFEEDYVSAIHILMPQVEATLRASIFAKGIIPLKLEKKKDKQALINEGELGGLLNRREVQNLLGRDFTEYLKVKFVEQTGVNFRNDVSHGLVDSIEEFNHTSSYSLIHVIVLLITL